MTNICSLIRGQVCASYSSRCISYCTYAAPTERSCQVVAGAEWQHADCGPRADTVQHAQHPANSAVAAACQYAQVRHLAEQLQTEIELCYTFRKFLKKKNHKAKENYAYDLKFASYCLKSH